MTTWEHTERLEIAWWGSCVNTYIEEMKQFQYADAMGLPRSASGSGVYIPMNNKTILDIGGGPCSLLLKCYRARGWVTDPFPVPHWVNQRYLAAGVVYTQVKAEEIDTHHTIGGMRFDEVWIYNVLEHVDSPRQVVANAIRAGRIVRIMDRLETPIEGPHRHSLRKADLDDWFGREGATTVLQDAPTHRFGGVQWYVGVFDYSGPRTITNEALGAVR